MIRVDAGTLKMGGVVVVDEAAAGGGHMGRCVPAARLPGTD